MPLARSRATPLPCPDNHRIDAPFYTPHPNRPAVHHAPVRRPFAVPRAASPSSVRVSGPRSMFVCGTLRVVSVRLVCAGTRWSCAGVDVVGADSSPPLPHQPARATNATAVSCPLRSRGVAPRMSCARLPPGFRDMRTDRIMCACRRTPYARALVSDERMAGRDGTR
ncbi:hypothetical protein HYPSUDRAFT_1021638 [Hypholoma sublateritium FD-334 SS-4]|uniref:Uncharacterized protein n=1 Tax=Hypholoma sublateritium (strain FD-334 SS-4) TaxID=945553 RepID=A0A0D2NLA2_HYPSF|nr:hypothetical protein HYPSUDRAFT_1021638 [Hypholoma sublateritium FD-334 SS-4]